MKSLGQNKFAVIALIMMVAASILTIGGVIIYGNSILRIFDEGGDDTLTGKHYAFICEDPADGFYRSIYEGARDAAEERGDYLENMGDNISPSTDRTELMELSIDAGVDGIIVEAGESEAMRELIGRASDKGIPVITAGSDNTSSERKSYVGFGYYDLGINYGKEILKHASDEEKRVLLLMSPEAEDSSQNLIYQGIMDTIDQAGSSGSFALETMAVPNTSVFGAEETISALIMRDDDLPDILVCLNELYTTCVCQSLVDYNRVGRVIVYGFYENSTILSSIQKNIIDATFTMDTRLMGSFCIEAMKEYEESGYVNEFLPADIKVVTRDNIEDYMKDKDEETP